jgi:hypothetical protein
VIVAQIDPNAVASAGIADLQTAIDALNALELQPGADIPGIDAHIKTLITKQAALQNQALRQIEDSVENQQAIAAMNKAAAALKSEAGNIASVATALTDAAKVVSAVTSLITALAPFI